MCSSRDGHGLNADKRAFFLADAGLYEDNMSVQEKENILVSGQQFWRVLKPFFLGVFRPRSLKESVASCWHRCGHVNNSFLRQSRLFQLHVCVKEQNRANQLASVIG